MRSLQGWMVHPVAFIDEHVCLKSDITQEGEGKEKEEEIASNKHT